MRWFEQHWQEEHADWIDQAKEAIQELYNEYKRRHSDEAIAIAIEPQADNELTEFERYNILSDDQLNGDELERFFKEDRTKPGTNALDWWRLNQERYPVRRHLAFDLLAAPASSSADERVFSEAGHVLDDEHFNTLDDLAESYQLL